MGALNCFPPPLPMFTSSRMNSSVLSWISVEVHSHPTVMKLEEEWSCAHSEFMSWASVGINHTRMRCPSSMRLWDRKITACTLILQVVIILLTRKCWKWPARPCPLCSRICWNFPCLYAPTLQQFKLSNRLVQEKLRWGAEHCTKAQEGGTCGRKHLRYKKPELINCSAHLSYRVDVYTNFMRCWIFVWSRLKNWHFDMSALRTGAKIFVRIISMAPLVLGMLLLFLLLSWTYLKIGMHIYINIYIEWLELINKSSLYYLF